MSNSRKRVKSNSSDSPELTRKKQDPYLSSQFIDVLLEENTDNPIVANQRKLFPWFKLHNVQSGVQLLNKEILDYYEYLKPTRKEQAVRKHVVSQLEKVVKELFPKSKLEVFGSFNTELYLPTSDIDLVLIDSAQQMSTTDVLETLAYKIEREGLSERMEVILKAKVPIIKYIDRQTKFSVDISVNTNNGLSSANIILKYCNRYQGLKELILLLKNYFYLRGLNEVYMGGIGSYTIMLLATSFLQIHPQLQKNRINATENLGMLFLEFFELYGKAFNYKDVCIRVHNNGAYMRKIVDKKGPIRLLSVQDPQDPDNDVSRGSYNIAEIRHACYNAFRVLTDEICKINHKNNHNSRDSKTRIHKSILVNIMGLDDKFCKHREFIEDIYNKLYPADAESIQNNASQSNVQNSNQGNKHKFFS